MKPNTVSAAILVMPNILNTVLNCKQWKYVGRSLNIGSFFHVSPLVITRQQLYKTHYDKIKATETILVTLHFHSLGMQLDQLD